MGQTRGGVIIRATLRSTARSLPQQVVHFCIPPSLLLPPSLTPHALLFPYPCFPSLIHEGITECTAHWHPLPLQLSYSRCNVGVAEVVQLRLSPQLRLIDQPKRTFTDSAKQKVCVPLPHSPSIFSLDTLPRYSPSIISLDTLPFAFLTKRRSGVLPKHPSGLLRTRPLRPLPLGPH